MFEIMALALSEVVAAKSPGAIHRLAGARYWFGPASFRPLDTDREIIIRAAGNSSTGINSSKAYLGGMMGSNT